MFRWLAAGFVALLIVAPNAFAAPKTPAPSPMPLVYNLLKSTADLDSFLVASGILLGKVAEFTELRKYLPKQVLKASPDNVRWVDTSSIKIGSSVLTWVAGKVSMDGKRVEFDRKKTILENFKRLEKEFSSENHASLFSLMLPRAWAQLPVPIGGLPIGASLQAFAMGFPLAIAQFGSLPSGSGKPTGKINLSCEACVPIADGFDSQYSDSIGRIYKNKIFNSKEGLIECIADRGNFNKYRYTFLDSDPEEKNVVLLPLDFTGLNKAERKLREELRQEDPPPAKVVSEIANSCHISHVTCGSEENRERLKTICEELTTANKAGGLRLATTPESTKQPAPGSPQPSDSNP